jgi:hypothetical protein
MESQGRAAIIIQVQTTPDNSNPLAAAVSRVARFACLAAVQAQWRRYVARKEYRKRHEAAITVQDHASRFLARRQVRMGASCMAHAVTVSGSLASSLPVQKPAGLLYLERQLPMCLVCFGIFSSNVWWLNDAAACMQAAKDVEEQQRSARFKAVMARHQERILVRPDILQHLAKHSSEPLLSHNHPQQLSA